MLQAKSILGVSITNEKRKSILEHVLKRIQSSNEKTYIITPNPEMLVYASKHLDYPNKLNHADVALPDGVGLIIAGWILGKPLKERIPGVDFMEELCKVTREKPLSMGFLGAKAGVAEQAAECLKRKYPWIQVAFAGDKWNEAGFGYMQRQSSSFKQDHAIQKGNKRHSTIDILFVAFGIPKQEEWIYSHIDKLPIKAAMGVGGAFDFLSGSVQRAPFIIRVIGLEWLFRLILQPWRWRRQLALIEFIFLVFKERFSKNK